MAERLVPTTPRLPRDLAVEILDRAARLDAEERFDMPSLRSAAADAGISQDAFDRALAEAIAARSQPVQQAPVAERDVEVPTRAFLVGIGTAALAISVASLALGAPSIDALAGAVVGAGGGLLGSYIYLLRKHR